MDLLKPNFWERGTPLLPKIGFYLIRDPKGYETKGYGFINLTLLPQYSQFSPGASLTTQPESRNNRQSRSS